MDREPEITTYRAPMRARSVEAGPFEGAEFGVRAGLVGTGEPLRRAPADLSEAILLTVDEHGYKAGRMLARFAELPPGSFVWTRVSEERFRLGRIAGSWRYEETDEARRTGIRQVRPADWLPDEIEFLEAPAAVPITFGRGGRNLQRINDRECQARTEEIWRDHNGGDSRSERGVPG